VAEPRLNRSIVLAAEIQRLTQETQIRVDRLRSLIPPITRLIRFARLQNQVTFFEGVLDNAIRSIEREKDLLLESILLLFDDNTGTTADIPRTPTPTNNHLTHNQLHPRDFLNPDQSSWDQLFSSRTDGPPNTERANREGRTQP
jgi:hypothetical protein